MTEKKVYPFTRDETITSEPTETTTFTYANSGWKDQLIKVNNDELTYDANGNVLTFGNRSFTWNTGRNLASITDETDNYSYTYDENGIRTSKTVNGVTTYYNTKDGLILSQSDGTNTFYFQYNSSGTPLGFILDGTQYFYITNQMGDVVGITEANGNAVCEYTYNEWGELIDIISVSGNNEQQIAVGNANPLRYRGYYYDSETGYYYLQSRYYDPSICRFLNADIPEIANTSKGIAVGENLFAYCNNNPVNKTDSLGTTSSTYYWNVLTKFLKNYLLKGKTIIKYTRMVRDRYDLCTAKVYYRKSRFNKNAFNITFGYKSAWKGNSSWLNNIGKRQKTINNYWNQINSIMTSGAPVSQAQADKNKAQIISSNVGMVSQIISAGFSAASISKKYNKIWGKNGIDYNDKNRYILFWVTNERGLNGLYLYKYSNGYVKKV